LRRFVRLRHAENLLANRQKWVEYLEVKSQVTDGNQEFMRIDPDDADIKRGGSPNLLNSGEYALISLEDVKLPSSENNGSKW
jgi:hypothetical protein